MDFDFTTIAPQNRYRLLTDFIGPCPIAPMSTRRPEGRNSDDNCITSDRQCETPSPGLHSVRAHLAEMES